MYLVNSLSITTTNNNKQPINKNIAISIYQQHRFSEYKWYLNNKEGRRAGLPSYETDELSFVVRAVSTKKTVAPLLRGMTTVLSGAAFAILKAAQRVIKSVSGTDSYGPFEVLSLANNRHRAICICLAIQFSLLTLQYPTLVWCLPTTLPQSHKTQVTVRHDSPISE
ncbi:hypothetical protein ACRALDRAFT_2045223 [Sodiomyces alcalophilus JCM 7366]|uniref:uncharacterized protein n=1 Tax=Sodiomyces alcalophilus JCM 7366 TaxID=591952 RepID=UPI0039B66A68